MTRIQFWILISISSLIVLCLLLQVIFSRQASYAQAKLVEARQIIEQGQTCEVRVRQLAGRIYQLSQQYSDANLKELLARQQISVSPGPATGAAGPSPTPAPSSTLSR